MIVLRVLLGRAIRHDVDAMAAFIKGNLAIRQGEEGPIAAGADILSGNEFRTALADQNAARRHELAAKSFHAQPLADAVASVTNAALSFFMCHMLIPFLKVEWRKLLRLDLFDLHYGQFLTMADALMIAFSAFHLKS